MMNKKIIDDAEIWSPEFISRKMLVRAALFDYASWFVVGAAVGVFIGLILG